MSSVDNKPIVVDNGAYCLKAGYAGEGTPQIIIPMVVGSTFNQSNSKDCFVGEHAKALSHDLLLSNPISNGMITDIDQLSIVWHYMFMKELRTDPTNHSVLVTEHPIAPAWNRKKLAEMVFEAFKMPSLYITSQSVLALYTTGRTTGLVFDMGTEQTSVVPIYQTYPISNAIGCYSIGGSYITEIFKQMMFQSNPHIINSISLDYARYLKEQACYISRPYPNKNRIDSVVYYTPDGSQIKLTHERYMAPEIFFDCQRTNEQRPIGLQNAIMDSVEYSPNYMRPEMYSNIVLSGGGCLFDGFVQRMQHELEKIVPNIIQIDKPHHQIFASWIGGSILGSLNTFEKICVSKAEYEEYGSNIVLTKCR